MLEIAVRKSKVEARGTVFDKCSEIMACTDGVVVMGRRLQDLEKVFPSQVEQTNIMGLETNKIDKIYDSFTKALTMKMDM
jgi:hypothetical protein